MEAKSLSITILSLPAACGAAFAAEASPEGDLKPCMGEPTIERLRLFVDDRFPTVVVAKNGSVGTARRAGGGSRYRLAEKKLEAPVDATRNRLERAGNEASRPKG